MTVPAPLASFWRDFAESVGGVDEARFHDAFAFGDGEVLASELGGLVMRGVKRATATPAWSFADKDQRMPGPGDLSIVTSWSGEPLCVIETRRVDVVPFREVTAEFAAVEGEGDGSLAFWQAAHRRFFTRECARAGRQFTEDMPVACERFEVVYRPPRADG